MNVSEGNMLPDATLVEMGAESSEQVALSSLTAGSRC